MQVQIGNPFALEGYRDPSSDDPERVRYRPLPGERVTSIGPFPEGTDVGEAAALVVVTLSRHMDMTKGLPAWIESDSSVLRELLCSHYNIKPTRTRPPTWGSGANGPYPTPADPDPKPKEN